MKGNKQLPGTRPRWRVPFAMAITIALLGLGLGLGGAVTSSASPSSVAQAQCAAPAWDFDQRFSYQAGDVVSHNGNDWRALFFTFGQEPGQGNLWQDLGPCAPSTTTTTAPTTTTTTEPGPTTTTTTTVPPGESVDGFYSASGPWAVTAESVSIPGDGGGSTLVYPSNLGASGYQHPILTFANGADATCPPNTSLFHHLASWGYVVVCPITGQILETHLVAAAEWAVAQNSDASSVFFEKLDTESVGAVGFSRGAGFSAIAAGERPDLFTTVVPISLADRVWQGDNRAVDALSNMGGIPVFFVAGTNEVVFFFIRLVTEPEQKFFFDQKPGAAARGAGVGIGHTLNPDDPRIGYITAWLKYILEGDEFAREAFAGDSPEINANPAWAWQEQKNLP